MKVSTFDRLLFWVAMAAPIAVVKSKATSSLRRDEYAIHQPTLVSRELDAKSGKAGKFDKALKHTKDSKFEKKSKSWKKEKSLKKSKTSKSDDYSDDDLFSDDYWESQCFFNYYFGDDDDFGFDDAVSHHDDVTDDGFPDLDGAGQCIETFAEKTYLYIDTEKALDCSESMEKVAWQSYPSCFELLYYSPYFCDDLYREFDQAYECIYDLIWGPTCYWDYSTEEIKGCAVHFANSFELDVEQILECEIDFYDELDDKCWSNNDDPTGACDAFDTCEEALWGFNYCTYDTSIKLSDFAGIMEQELGIDDFAQTIYNGSIDYVEVLDTLQGYEYDGLVGTNESEWSEFVECITWEFEWYIDDWCFWVFEGDIVNGCVQHFADSFEDLDAEALMTCEVDFIEEYEQKCELDFTNTNQEVCETLDQCGALVFWIADCASDAFGMGFLELVEAAANSEFSDILPSIYDGTINLDDAYQRLVDYDGSTTEYSNWDDFVLCLSEFEM